MLVASYFLIFKLKGFNMFEENGSVGYACLFKSHWELRWVLGPKLVTKLPMKLHSRMKVNVVINNGLIRLHLRWRPKFGRWTVN